VRWRPAGANGGQLRAVTGQLPAALGSAQGRTPRSSLVGRAGDILATLRTLGRRLRANATWQGSAVRHALRLAAAVLLAELIGLVTGLARPYWIAVIAVLVLRPDFASTSLGAPPTLWARSPAWASPPLQRSPCRRATW
jgi:uncharacterized membrane protein YccC